MTTPSPSWAPTWKRWLWKERTGNEPNQKSRFLAATLVGMAVVAPAQAGDFTTLKENIFVCISPQAYDDAMVRVRELSGRNLEPLKKDLSENKLCMFVDPEMADNIMAPFAVVLQRDGTKVQVQFIVTFRKKSSSAPG